jgi:hypothetical protein
MITIPDYIAAGLGLKSCELPEDELEGRMLLAGITKGSDVFLSPLLDTVTKAPHVFNDGVLSKLDTVDLMMLSRVNKKMRRITKVHKHTTVTDTKEDIFRVPTFVRSVALLRWARENGCPWDERTCAAVAAGGNLEVLKWARENGCPWDEETCASAAEGGHLDILKWARENSCPWDEWTCAYAAGGGHLEVLKWARENSCPWDEHTCYNAADGGHLEVLKWARANGCPWDEHTCSAAADGGHLEVLKWARENGCPAPRPKLGDLTRTASTAKGSCEDVVHTVFMGPQGEHENGLNVYDVISALKGRFTSGQLWQAIESLVSDGHLYSTVDSRHFRATLL